MTLVKLYLTVNLMSINRNRHSSNAHLQTNYNNTNCNNNNNNNNNSSYHIDQRFNPSNRMLNNNQTPQHNFVNNPNQNGNNYNSFSNDHSKPGVAMFVARLIGFKEILLTIIEVVHQSFADLLGLYVTDVNDMATLLMFVQQLIIQQPRIFAQNPQQMQYSFQPNNVP